MRYFVEIVKFESDEVVKRIDCGTSERHADRVDMGANINLNHEDYFTRVVSEGDEETAQNETVVESNQQGARVP